MPKTGTTDLPLHYGRVPRWLFQRIALLAREVSLAIVTEFGAQELLRRFADPFWFQSFGCVLGFDWHSSGLTTTVCGALKVGLKEVQDEIGLFVARGKGGTSRHTPRELESQGANLQVDPAGLVYASRMSAKVNNNALQDGYQIYHHASIFGRAGRWTVVQQGTNLRRKQDTRCRLQAPYLAAWMARRRLRMLHQILCPVLLKTGNRQLATVDPPARLTHRVAGR
ncbi:MAG: DUF763 domain-containing protein [Chloroflexi bacterium]|nr:DUF763 domain-containing protein [Chloroflexota bacterium]